MASVSVPQPNPPRDIWSKRLAIGLPFVALLLIAIVANQIGGVLIAQDLRADYQELVDNAQPAAADEMAGMDHGDQPLPPPAVAPDNRPEVTVKASLSEFAITSAVKSIPAWATVTVEATNDGQVPHDISSGTTASDMLNPGDTGTITVDAPASGSLTFLCTVPGHEAAGMTMSIPINGGKKATVDQQAAAGEEAAAATNFATPENAAQYDGPKPAMDLRDPAAPDLPAAKTHNVTLTVDETVAQVAKDVYQQVWTFNGTVPGPTLRVHVGDQVNIKLINPAKAGLGHSVDFHASQVAWNDEMATIAPGETKIYKFTATHAGFFMYHCGTAPALHHIGNGMYGGIIVEPEGGLPPVDHEFAFVQGEYYVGPQGEPGDLAKMSEGAPSPDYVVFNGTANQYADHPIEVGVGDRIRTWVLNAGPSVDSSFHVVGTIFDTVMKEGVTLQPDNAQRYGSQAIDLSPAQGGYAEFTLAEDGLYPIVTHAFNHVGKGALGLFKAGNGGPEMAGGH